MHGRDDMRYNVLVGAVGVGLAGVGVGVAVFSDNRLTSAVVSNGSVINAGNMSVDATTYHRIAQMAVAGAAGAVAADADVAIATDKLAGFETSAPC